MSVQICVDASGGVTYHPHIYNSTRGTDVEWRLVTPGWILVDIIFNPANGCAFTNRRVNKSRTRITLTNGNGDKVLDCRYQASVARKPGSSSGQATPAVTIMQPSTDPVIRNIP